MKITSSLKTVLLVLSFLLFGVIIGRHSAIISAELTSVTNTGYEITFGESTHIYEY